jgi:outer membrane protein assembly factor BamD
MKKNCFLITLLLLVLVGCSKEEKKISIIKESQQNLEIITAYNEAYKALDEGDPYFAAKKFLEAELLLPQSKWAPKSALMASYSYYLQNYYAEALSNLERFLLTYPKSKDVAYVHYLIGMCYYETIEDEKRDSAPLILAKDKFNFIIVNFPDTDFALDSKFKLGVIEDLLASKEMYLGRHYIKKGKWIAAINRFKNVINDYDRTVFVEEALHRLVEINFRLGLKEESQKYANILGYNYLSSDWYEKSYKVFNKDYSKQLKDYPQKDQKGALKIFKKLFE